MARPLGNRQVETLLRIWAGSADRLVLLDPKSLRPSRVVRSLIDRGFVTARRTKISHWLPHASYWCQEDDSTYRIALTAEGRDAVLEKQRREARVNK